MDKLKWTFVAAPWSPPKTCSKVVLTGSFLPEKFKESDADFNIGTALGSLLFYSNKKYELKIQYNSSKSPKETVVQINLKVLCHTCTLVYILLCRWGCVFGRLDLSRWKLWGCLHHAMLSLAVNHNICKLLNWSSSDNLHLGKVAKKKALLVENVH